MIDWNSPVLTYGLLAVFFALLHVVVSILAKASGKRFEMKFLLLIAGVFLCLMSASIDFKMRYCWATTKFVEYFLAIYLGGAAIIELLTAAIYRLFHIDEKLDREDRLLHPITMNIFRK